MQNPAAVTDANGEWFEVYNPMSVAADLNGLSIQSGSGSHVIDGDGGPCCCGRASIWFSASMARRRVTAGCRSTTSTRGSPWATAATR